MKVSSSPPAGFPAPADADTAGAKAFASVLRDRIDRLHDLDGAGLREEWRRLCRSEPPRLSPDLLRRAIAYRLQELELGGLPKWARQSLALAVVNSGAADTAREPDPKPSAPSLLKPGARLVREWHGRTHVVTVLGDDAFEFEARRHRSLTQIACEITGAHWSGPRFFGLVKRKAETEPKPPASSTAPVHVERALRSSDGRQGQSVDEVRRQAVGAGEPEARCDEAADAPSAGAAKAWRLTQRRKEGVDG